MDRDQQAQPTAIIHYHADNIPVQLGDNVEVKLLWFWRKKGVIAYISGVSPLNRSLEWGDGGRVVTIQTSPTRLISMMLAPYENRLRPNVTFLSRKTGEYSGIDSKTIIS